jgi:hypothetical protein
MTGNDAFAVVAITAGLGVLGVDAAAARSHAHGTGYVVPCSLDGINPIYHRQIFGDPAVARSYGFVQGPDHVWRVASDCRKH